MHFAALGDEGGVAFLGDGGGVPLPLLGDEGGVPRLSRPSLLIGAGAAEIEVMRRVLKIRGMNWNLILMNEGVLV